jgi:hypothetical protein
VAITASGDEAIGTDDGSCLSAPDSGQINLRVRLKHVHLLKLIHNILVGDLVDPVVLFKFRYISAARVHESLQYLLCFERMKRDIVHLE